MKRKISNIGRFKRRLPMGLGTIRHPDRRKAAHRLACRKSRTRSKSVERSGD